MSIITYPLNGITYDADDAATYLCTRNSGVFADSSCFDLTISGDMEITISTGQAWIKNTDFAGKSVCMNEDAVLSVSIGESALNRIDRVVLRFDKEANETTLTIDEGTAASSASAPDITQTETIYELGLYLISVPAGTTELTSDMITDTRQNESVCGIMSDGVNEISTGDFQEQAAELLDAISADASAVLDSINSNAAELIATLEETIQGVEDNSGMMFATTYDPAGGAKQVAFADEITPLTEANPDGNDSAALGTNAYAGNSGTAIGTSANASGNYSTAVGVEATAVGIYGSAYGYNATGSGNNSVAVGPYANAYGAGSISLGMNSLANDDYCFAVGDNAVAYNGNSIAIGSNSYTGGVNSIAIGAMSGTIGVQSIAIGPNAGVTTYSVAIGANAGATGVNAVAIGPCASAYGNYAVAFGKTAYSGGINSVAVGRSSLANGEYSAALGYDAEANGYGCISIGMAAVAGPVVNANTTVSNSVAIGVYANTRYNSSVAIGEEAWNLGDYGTAVGAITNAAENASAFGFCADATGVNSVAMGVNTHASGPRAIAIGMQTSAGGNYAVAIGSNANAGGISGIAIGTTAVTNANGVAIGRAANAALCNTIAIGYNAVSSYNNACSVGYNAHAGGSSATAVGYNSYASGGVSVSIGHSSKASGYYSTALGSLANVSGNYSTAIGASAVTSNINSIQLGNASNLASLTCRVSLTVSSDIRDKTDITEMDDGAVEFLNHIKAIRYVNNERELYIDEDALSDEDKEKKAKYGLCAYDTDAHDAGTKKGDRIRVGVSAQEVQEALESVYGDSSYANLVDDNLHDIEEEVPEDVESRLAVNYTGFIPFLIKAVQELDTRITALEDA